MLVLKLYDFRGASKKVHPVGPLIRGRITGARDAVLCGFRRRVCHASVSRDKDENRTGVPFEESYRRNNVQTFELGRCIPYPHTYNFAEGEPTTRSYLWLSARFFEDLHETLLLSHRQNWVIHHLSMVSPSRSRTFNRSSKITKY